MGDSGFRERLDDEDLRLLPKLDDVKKRPRFPWFWWLSLKAQFEVLSGEFTLTRIGTKTVAAVTWPKR